MELMNSLLLALLSTLINSADATPIHLSARYPIISQSRISGVNTTSMSDLTPFIPLAHPSGPPLMPTIETSPSILLLPETLPVMPTVEGVPVPSTPLPPSPVSTIPTATLNLPSYGPRALGAAAGIGLGDPEMPPLPSTVPPDEKHPTSTSAEHDSNTPNTTVNTTTTTSAPTTSTGGKFTPSTLPPNSMRTTPSSPTTTPGSTSSTFTQAPSTVQSTSPTPPMTSVSSLSSTAASSVFPNPTIPSTYSISSSVTSNSLPSLSTPALPSTSRATPIPSTLSVSPAPTTRTVRPTLRPTSEATPTPSTHHTATSALPSSTALSSDSKDISITIGSIICGLLFSIVILAFVFLKRRRSSRQPSRDDNTTSDPHLSLASRLRRLIQNEDTEVTPFQVPSPPMRDASPIRRGKILVDARSREEPEQPPREALNPAVDQADQQLNLLVPLTSQTTLLGTINQEHLHFRNESSTLPPFPLGEESPQDSESLLHDPEPSLPHNQEATPNAPDISGVGSSSSITNRANPNPSNHPEDQSSDSMLSASHSQSTHFYELDSPHDWIHLLHYLS